MAKRNVEWRADSQQLVHGSCVNVDNHKVKRSAAMLFNAGYHAGP